MSLAQKLKAYGRKEMHFQNAAICAAAVCSGLIAVGYAKLFKLGEGAFAELTAGHEEIVFVLTPLAFLIAWALVRFVAPEASGSGIPQVLAANELVYEGKSKDLADRLLSIKVMLVKILASLICLAGGGALGREGPTIQISASLFHFFGRLTRRVIPDSGSQIWIVSGAGAGLAAAFNTPLGGIVYAIEELGSQYFTRVRNVLLIAIILSGLVSQMILGDYLYLGSPKIFLLGGMTLPMAVLVGFATGLLGAAWAQLLFYLVQLRSKIKSNGWLAAVAIVSGLLMAALILRNHYASGTGIVLIDDLLFKSQLAGLETTAIRFFGTIVTYLCGSAGGIFSPSLAVGAGLGSFIGQIFGFTDGNILVLLGMIGFLTGVTRVPFTSFILVMEMTNEHAAILPMMIAALCASLGANLLGSHSFYEQMKDRYLQS